MLIYLVIFLTLFAKVFLVIKNRIGILCFSLGTYDLRIIIGTYIEYFYLDLRSYLQRNYIFFQLVTSSRDCCGNSKDAFCFCCVCISKFIPTYQGMCMSILTDSDKS